MKTKSNRAPLASAALQRLGSLVQLGSNDVAAIERAAWERSEVSPRCEIHAEGARIGARSILLSGWACHVRELLDGRRQILGFLLPGDLLGHHQHGNAVASTSVIAITEVVFCRAPESATGNLAQAYAVSAATDLHYLYQHITRLGRLSASERIADWLLEMRERLASCGLALGNELPLPLTQDVIADTLGLTNIHVSRALQTMRRDGLIEISEGRVKIHDEQRLVSLVDFRSSKVIL